jgi:hypothetical protein
MTQYRHRRSDSSCFQCDMDIAHVCYARQPGARWGWTDETVATLEAAQRLLSRPTASVPTAGVSSGLPARRAPLKSKRRVR